MARHLTASDRKRLIKMASTMPKGSPDRKAILAGLSKSADDRRYKSLGGFKVGEFVHIEMDLDFRRRYVGRHAMMGVIVELFKDGKDPRALVEFPTIVGQKGQADAERALSELRKVPGMKPLKIK